MRNNDGQTQRKATKMAPKGPHKHDNNQIYILGRWAPQGRPKFPCPLSVFIFIFIFIFILVLVLFLCFSVLLVPVARPIWARGARLPPHEDEGDDRMRLRSRLKKFCANRWHRASSCGWGLAASLPRLMRQGSNSECLAWGTSGAAVCTQSLDAKGPPVGATMAARFRKNMIPCHGGSMCRDAFAPSVWTCRPTLAATMDFSVLPAPLPRKRWRQLR